MKRVLVTLMAGLIFTACTKKVTTYTINGTWKGGDGEVVYLKKSLGNEAYEIIDSAVVANETFKMQKPLGDVDERILDIGGTTNIVILDSVPLTVSCETISQTVQGKEKKSVSVNIKGSIEQDIFKAVLNAQQGEMLMMLGLAFIGKDEKNAHLQDSIAQLYIAAKKNTEKTIDSLVENYPDSHAVALIINNFVAKQRELAEVERMYAHLTPRIKNAYLGKKLGATLEQMRRTAVGSIAPDFTLTTPDGQELSLASLRGNYVLVDFWASWCGPCLREVPNVKKIYDKFHDKGFEIIGVSLDEDKEAWINAIDKHGLNWKHVSSLKGWNCPVAQLYSVTGIPAMFLLDKDGKIVASGLRGEELTQYVENLFQAEK